MKKFSLFIGMLVAVFALNAQNKEAYIKAMSGGLEQMGTAKSIEDLQAVAGQFERIAAGMEGDWYSNYYAGLAYTRMSMMVEGISNKDEYSNKGIRIG